jgi:hypothetical protein
MRGFLRPAAASACVLLSSCGDSSSANSLRYDPKAANVPACTHAGKAIPLPRDFPLQFPFPQGTAINKVGPLPIKGVKGIEIDGFVPSTVFKDTVQFFRDEIPKAGFKLLDWQADAPNDSEGTYSGHGHIGGWQLKKLFGCTGAMHFASSSEPPSAKSPK